MNNYVKIIKTVLFILAVSIFLYLGWMNFSPLGQQTLVYDFEENSFFSPFRPSTRANEIICDEYCHQEIYDNPVYFEFFHPRKFDNVNITIEYFNPDKKEVSIGIKTGEGYQYFEEKLETTVSDNNWTIGTASLNLSMAYTNKNVYEFVFSAPHIKNNDKSIKVRRIEFKLTKKTLFEKFKLKYYEMFK